MACSIAVVSLSGWNSGSEMAVPIHVVLVSGSDENIEFIGSFV
jgi:hypothetical protein